MFPISISQLKSINLFKLFKLILWYFLRNFQLKNDNTFQSVLIIGDKLESITLKLPKLVSLIIQHLLSLKILNSNTYLNFLGMSKI